MCRSSRSGLTAALLACALLATLASCGNPPADPKTLLPEAKKNLDGAQTLAFHITSDKAGQTANGTYIIGADGVMKRPDAFSGTVNVSISGLLVDVQVVTTGGKFYAMLPFPPVWKIAKPSDYGFESPSFLLDPNKGLSSLITQSHSPTVQDNDRYNGEELYEIKTKVAGDLVNNVLTSADTSVENDVTFGIDVNSHQLRKIILYGPFFHKGQNSAYTVILDNYGQNATVTPPV